MLYFLALITFINTLGIGALLFYLRRSIHRQRALDRRLTTLPEEVWSAVNVQNRLKAKGILPAAGDWALDASAIAQVIMQFERRKPETLVEFGAGISTLVLGLLLKEQGRGKLISIEHDPKYADHQMQLLKTFGVDEYVDIRVTDLSEQPDQGSEFPWYDPSLLDDIQTVDMVLVDGPPMLFGATVRYPAGALMLPRLSATGCLILDDAGRPGEREIRKRWLRENPDMSERFMPLSKGLAVFEHNVSKS